MARPRYPVYRYLMTQGQETYGTNYWRGMSARKKGEHIPDKGMLGPATGKARLVKAKTVEKDSRT